VGDLARLAGQEVYIIAGASGSKGTVKNEGRITIPSATWKVAVVLPRDAGLASIDSWDDVQVLAVLMPNDAGIRNVAWETYLVTVDQIEAASGFDVLSALRDDIEIAVESNTVPPQASLDGPWSAYAGDPLALSGAASTDADGDGLTYAWDFGDGSTAEGATASHTYATAGEYAVPAHRHRCARSRGHGDFDGEHHAAADRGRARSCDRLRALAQRGRHHQGAQQHRARDPAGDGAQAVPARGTSRPSRGTSRARWRWRRRS
jgi:hypothetical protein